MSKANWQVAIVYTKLSLREDSGSFTHDRDEVYKNHRWGQVFAFVRGYFKTRGGLSPRALKYNRIQMENVYSEWFNLFNETDCPVHVDEAVFNRFYDNAHTFAQEYFQTYLHWGDGDPYKENRTLLEKYGVQCMTVYRSFSDHVVCETVYIKREGEM